MMPIDTTVTGPLGPLRVFLSHSSTDKDIVRLIAQTIRVPGLIDVWLDEWSIDFGDSIPGRINEALASCDILFLCLSARSVSSRWVASEWRPVFDAEMRGITKKIVPILLEHCDIPPLIADRKYMDLRHVNRSQLWDLRENTDWATELLKWVVAKSPAYGLLVDSQERDAIVPILRHLALKFPDNATDIDLFLRVPSLPNVETTGRLLKKLCQVGILEVMIFDGPDERYRIAGRIMRDERGMEINRAFWHASIQGQYVYVLDRDGGWETAERQADLGTQEHLKLGLVYRRAHSPDVTIELIRAPDSEAFFRRSRDRRYAVDENYDLRRYEALDRVSVTKAEEEGNVAYIAEIQGAGLSQKQAHDLIHRVLKLHHRLLLVTLDRDYDPPSASPGR